VADVCTLFRREPEAEPELVARRSRITSRGLAACFGLSYTAQGSLLRWMAKGRRQAVWARRGPVAGRRLQATQRRRLEAALRAVSGITLNQAEQPSRYQMFSLTMQERFYAGEHEPVRAKGKPCAVPKPRAWPDLLVYALRSC
jgi:hypothetical protein